jgi:hypothetical protein
VQRKPGIWFFPTLFSGKEEDIMLNKGCPLS